MLKKILLSSLVIGTMANAQKPILPDILKPKISKNLVHSTFKRTGPTVQIGILLDTSGSMEGLIDQAKDQLWKIVNEVAKANKGNEDVAIQVGLFEYGKSSIPSYEGYLQMLSPLTSDLDKVSEELFKLRTNGGEEYAGKVILESVNRFDWSTHKNDLRILIIAGNEPFTQGDVPYREAIFKAVDYGIVVNTIFCGNEEEGRRTFWADGAKIGNGEYFNINHNDKRVYIATPYDDQIIIIGKKLNDTYILYGAAPLREAKKENIIAQDRNSLGLSKGSYVERNIMKSKKQYAQAESDVVSSFMKDEESIQNISGEYMPSEFEGKSDKEIKKIVTKKKEERLSLQKEMEDLETKRIKFLAEKSKTGETDLGSAIIKTIRIQAEFNGFEFKK